MAEADGEGVGGVRVGRVGESEGGGGHALHLFFGGGAVVGDGPFYGGGGVAVHRDALAGGADEDDGLGLSDGEGGFGESALAAADEGVFDGDGVGAEYVDHIEDVGVELVEAVFDGHTGGEGDYAVVVGGGGWGGVQDAVAHAEGAGVDGQDAH